MENRSISSENRASQERYVHSFTRQGHRHDRVPDPARIHALPVFFPRLSADVHAAGTRRPRWNAFQVPAALYQELGPSPSVECDAG